MDIEKATELIYQSAIIESERKPQKGERSAIEIVNDFANKAMSFTSEKLNQLEDRLQGNKEGGQL